MLATLWFCLLAFMLTAYVVLDGFDHGTGALHLYVARTDEERRLVLRSIGPVWDGNEVWLVAGGGTLYFAFPRLYASSFSGFYLPLIIVLWLLVLRGISIEFRSHLESPVWKPFWDVIFSGASLLLAVFFGAALANVVRGVPLDADGFFFNPLWTTFSPGDAQTGILDWYTVVVGATAAVVLMVHGAYWIAYKTEGEVQARARSAVTPLWILAVLGTAGTTVATFVVQPLVLQGLAARPWGWIFPALALGGLFSAFALGRKGRDGAAFLAWAGYLVGMMASVAVGLYPYVLPAVGDPTHALTVQNAAAPAYGLKVGLAWWIPGILLALGYFTFLYRHFAGKVTLEGEGY